MKPVDALATVQFVGIAVATLSSVWGVFGKRSTYTDTSGHTRLTAAGQITLALVLLASTISAVSFGVGTLEKQEDARALAAREAQDRIEASVRQETILAAEANTREIAAETRAEQATSAAAARDRELLIRRDVTFAAARNIAKADQELIQLTRVLQPIGTPTISLTWRWRPTLGERSAWQLSLRPWADALQERYGPGIRDLIALDKAGREPTNEDLAKSEGPPGVTWSAVGTQIQRIAITPESPIYPKFNDDPFLWSIANRRLDKVAIYAVTPRSTEKIYEWIETTPSVANYDNGDLDFLVPSNDDIRQNDKANTTITTDTAGRWFEATTKLTIIPEYTKRTGRIVAIPDLSKAIILVFPSSTITFNSPELQLRFERAWKEVRLISIEISIDNRTWRLKESQILQTRSSEHDAVFAAGPIGEPTY